VILAFTNDKERANWNWDPKISDSPNAQLPTYVVRSTASRTAAGTLIQKPEGPDLSRPPVAAMVRGGTKKDAPVSCAGHANRDRQMAGNETTEHAQGQPMARRWQFLIRTIMAITLVLSMPLAMIASREVALSVLGLLMLPLTVGVLIAFFACNRHWVYVVAFVGLGVL
jgi:hypothetical protein